MRKYDLHDFHYDFPNEDAAFDYVLALKKPPVKMYRRKNTKSYSTSKGEYYAPLKGTIFENVKLDLDVWFLAVFLIHYNEYWSIKDFKDRLKVNYVTAFRILKKIRPEIDRSKTFTLNLDRMIMGKYIRRKVDN